MKKLPDFSKYKVLVIGDIMLDQYIFGSVNRISPEAPVPVMNWEHTRLNAGGAANVALNIKSLGARVKLLSSTGKDLSGAKLMEVLAQEGLDVGSVFQEEGETTTVKTRLIAGSQHLLRLDEENTTPIDSVLENKVMQELDTIIRDWEPDAIILEDYNKGLLTRDLIHRITSGASDRGIFLSVDPKLDQFTEFRNFGLVKANLREVNEVLNTRFEANFQDLCEAAEELQEKMTYQKLMITLGELGIFMAEGTTRMIVPTESLDIVDVCGAGDAVISIATLCLLDGMSLEEASCWANKGGASVCRHLGVVAVRREELVCQ